MMAYLSDIDLATLHKKRLDEKNQYKLSWWTRRFYDEDDHPQKTDYNSCEDKKVKAKTSKSKTKASSKAIKANDKPPASAAKGESDGNNNTVNRKTISRHSRNVDINGNKCRNQEGYYDEGYCSSPTARRRSGTWP